MSRHELARGNKSLMERVGAMIRATLPRQARVTRTEGNSVWVRFLGDEAGSPEAKFPSTVAGVPPATMGWVITLGGRKGLFVATGIPKAVIPPMQNSAASINTSSPGHYYSPSHSITISNLIPSRIYTVDWEVSVRTLGTASRSLRPAMESQGSSTNNHISHLHNEDKDATWTESRWRNSITASSSGTVMLTPGVQNVSGVVNVNWITFIVSIY